ncbi:MAG: sulfatase-like hydrolase/transferase [Microscillaceae bacterium]
MRKTLFRSPRHRLWLGIVIGLLLLSTYLLWPLTSSEWEIRFDAEKIAFKEKFLRLQKAEISSDRPNIIIILADDLGKTDISLYGSPHLQTPWMDSLGLKGATFTEAYVTAPICSPSRAALLTGRYQQRFGYEYQPQNRYLRNRLEYLGVKYFLDTDFWTLSEGMSFPDRENMTRQGLPPEEITLADLLKKQGYHTGIIGKWHLGHHQPFLPNHRGFDYQYGFYEAFSLFADTNAVGIVNQRHPDFSDPHIWGQGREGTCAIRRNDEIIEEKEYLTFAIAREARQFITKHQKQPFFLYLPFNAPHTPFQVTKAYFDRFVHVKDRNKRVYYAMIQALDDAIGQIVQHLRELGLEKNTLICFASDNGGASYTYATDNAPLKGGKMTNFEGGINIPMMMYWPGVIPAGQEITYPVTVMDFFATAIGLAQADLPQDRTYDGQDLLPLLTQAKQAAPHKALFWRTDFNRAVRKGPWKLILNLHQGDTLLYHLTQDKTEHINRARQHPDMIRQLLRAYQEWEKGLEAPRWPRVMDFVIEIRDTLYRFAM